MRSIKFATAVLCLGVATALPPAAVAADAPSLGAVEAIRGDRYYIVPP